MLLGQAIAPELVIVLANVTVAGALLVSLRSRIAEIRGGGGRHAQDAQWAVIEGSPIATAVVDHEDRILRCNPAMHRLTGYPDLSGITLRSLVRPVDGHEALPQDGGGPWTVRLGAGAHAPVVDLHVADTPVPGVGRVVQAADVSARVAEETRLRGLLGRDALTGLVSRRGLCEAIGDLPAGLQSALIVLDLDGFKSVNDAAGHVVGDALLVDIADLLRAIVPADAIVSRIGGDKFGILLPDVSPSAARSVPTTVLGALRHRTRVTGAAGPAVTASLGVVQFGDDRTLSPDDAIACAELAMYDAKDAGRNRVAVYDHGSGRREGVAERQLWIQRLRALDGHLEAFAQPIVSTDLNDRVRRFELLVRYRDDDGQLVPPIAFLPIAERSGLMGGIDRRMLRTAVELILASSVPIEVAVNLSAQTFVDPALPGFLDTLSGGGLPEGCLLIEITETAALADATVVAAVAAALRERGCKIALDDFGSGFATFNYLQRLDVDVLKIDGGFIRDLHTSETNLMIVQSIVSLARSLGLPVIAEQVESPAALQLLVELGVEYVQGYLFARPQPVAELLAGPTPQLVATAPAPPPASATRRP